MGKVARQTLLDEFSNVVQSSNQPQVSYLQYSLSPVQILSSGGDRSLDFDAVHEPATGGLSQQSSLASFATSPGQLCSQLSGILVRSSVLFLSLPHGSFSVRFRVQLSKLFINLVPEEDLHKPGSIYKLIIRYIRQKHPNLVHVIDDVSERCVALLDPSAGLLGREHR